MNAQNAMAAKLGFRVVALMDRHPEHPQYALVFGKAGESGEKARQPVGKWAYDLWNMAIDNFNARLDE